MRSPLLRLLSTPTGVMNLAEKTHKMDSFHWSEHGVRRGGKFIRSLVRLGEGYAVSRRH
ncbi:hypothetical protein [Nonomuraea turkmeniaca]|uniref:hypothetical protein n=1 Tax=Nonomuraea turkmeniaca TaxID=103838 RepID=UPI00147780DB|nr:hypothetical protein [Nonomuraea turkmeniaca]